MPAGLFSKDTVQVTVDSSSGQTLACGDSNRPTINARLIPVGTLSQARSSIAVASAGNKILFAGGSGHSSRVDIYDISTNKWSTAELSEGRGFGIAAAANGNKIFFAGGEAGDGTWPSDVVDIYDVSTNTWTVAHLSLGGDDIAAAAVGTRFFLPVAWVDFRVAKPVRGEWISTTLQPTPGQQPHLANTRLEDIWLLRPITKFTFPVAQHHGLMRLLRIKSRFTTMPPIPGQHQACRKQDTNMQGL